jgi:hypothetical protein
MANGGGPIPERPQDYTLIKNGECVTTGTYNGCIKVGLIYYWLSRKPRAPYYWVHNQGVPGAAQVLMTKKIWDQCKNGGTLTYDDEGQGWLDGSGNLWQWAGQARENITLAQP